MMIKGTQYEFVYDKFVDNLSSYVCHVCLDEQGTTKGSVNLADVTASINILKFIGKEKFNFEVLTDKAYDTKKDVIELFNSMVSELKMKE